MSKTKMSQLMGDRKPLTLYTIFFVHIYNSIVCIKKT